jgi:MutS domain V/MutS domain III
MAELQQPRQYYHTRIENLNLLLAKQQKKKIFFAWARFSTVVLAGLFLWQLWSVSTIAAPGVSALLLVLFFVFLFKDLKNSSDIRNTETLIAINKEELLILEHQFTHLPDGLQYKPAEHDYANDLDIFGKASLYQYINRTTAEQSNKLLSEWLLAPAAANVITERQEAVKELKEKPEWRQQLQAIGTIKKITTATQNHITNWLLQPVAFSNTGWKILRILYPLISLTVLLLFITEFIPASQFTLLFVLFIAISSAISRIIMPAYNQLAKITAEIETLSESALHIENEKFTGSLLKELQSTFSHKNKKASGTIKQLKDILGRFDYRLNLVVYIPLNAFLLWDLQQILFLEKWKANNKEQVPKWYESLAAVESLSTLGNLSFNRPHWCFPALNETRGTFTAEEMGHPLIPADKIVNNTFSTAGIGKMNLVTGSNMAGKSTFLRSIGVNTVLAMTGAPVCAGKMNLHPVKIISTMRVNDNLEESTSTFYAELKKLKIIIEAVNKGENVFLLLDEILHGTNSLDRHTGSEALIKQLIKNNAVGLLATHDLKLAELINQYPDNITNYHFDVQVNNEELYFDYKLKKGICQSMNASVLMKKIGIDL